MDSPKDGDTTFCMKLPLNHCKKASYYSYIYEIDLVEYRKCHNYFIQQYITYYNHISKYSRREGVSNPTTN